MVRPIGSQVTTTRREPSPVVDSSVAWSARLVQPKRMLAASTQVCVVHVEAPVVLDGPVYVLVRTRSFTAEWSGDSGQRREAHATLTALTQGRHAVRVKVGQAVLDAGKIRVT